MATGQLLGSTSGEAIGPIPDMTRQLRSALKYLMRFAARALILPLWLGYRLSSFCLGPDQALSGYSQLVSLLPGLIGIYLRKAFYDFTLPLCGHDVCVMFGTTLSHCASRFGNRVYIGPFSTIGLCTLGDDVLIGAHVSIANGRYQHGIDRVDMPIREQEGSWPQISIGADTWIGDRVVILADVGHHCVVGAGAVVISPLPDYAVAVGVPARIVRYRDAQHGVHEHPQAEMAGTDT